jgi:hypothetical protein
MKLQYVGCNKMSAKRDLDKQHFKRFGKRSNIKCIMNKIQIIYKIIGYKTVSSSHFFTWDDGQQ